jgi:squalene-associated FAD-dependent desaturase
MQQPRLHIVGAGLAGLACALRAAEAGISVSLYEAAAQAGGRCRSYHDDVLDRDIDNGNHLLLSGNTAAAAYIKAIGAVDGFVSPLETIFPFVDLGTGERWSVHLNDGSVPWWILNKNRRVKGTGLSDYVSILSLMRASRSATVSDCVDKASPLYERFWEPLTVAVLNAAPDEGAASLLIPVMQRTFLKGGAHCRPMVARKGLSDSLVNPALAFLNARGADIRFHHRLRAVERNDLRVTALQFADRTIALDPSDAVVLALPPMNTQEVVPEIRVPTGVSPIVNAHFIVGGVGRRDNPILGLVGGTAQWLFFRGDIVSVTVSAADDLVTLSAEELATRLWRDVTQAIGRPGAPLPVHRIVKEKRATFAQTPAALDDRPGTVTNWRNLALAGDWTDTGLPATIEGAITSGFAAGDHMIGVWPLPAMDDRPSRASAA